MLWVMATRTYVFEVKKEAGTMFLELKETFTNWLSFSQFNLVMAK
jgi:hypothetical protein